MKNLKKQFLLATTVISSLTLCTPVAHALESQQFKVIGMSSGIPASSYDEIPFWEDTLPEKSNGKITATITPIDQMGIESSAMLRMLKIGIADFAGIDITKMAADDARFEGCDLAGISTDPKLARAGCEAYKPVLSEQMEKNWNTKLLAIGANTPQVFWCRDEVTSLEDLKGKKIRVFNNTLRDLVKGIGATSVSIGFSEVVPALNNGVVDCAVTGTLSGNNAGWGEVAKSVFMLPIAWSVNAVVVNKSRWDSLSQEEQSFMSEQIAAYEDKLWDSLDKFNAQANACNSGAESCSLGKPTQIKLVEPTSQELKEVQAIVKNSVLPSWAARCGSDCLDVWNETVGTAVGYSALN